MSVAPYPNYNDSGVDWLGNVPSHWELVPLKRLIDIQNGADYKHVEQDEGYPVIGSGGPFTYASAYLFDGESVLLGRKGTVDKPLYVTGRFWTVDTMYWSKICPGTNGRFAFYTATTIPFGYYTTSTALPSMTQAALNGHLVVLPPLVEQNSIVAFLDRETAKIDALVVEQRRLIALLKEKRQAIISHAVTKGLNPSAPMEDSCIEWLGEVPAHWTTVSVRYLADILRGKFTHRPRNDPAMYDGENPFIQTGDITAAAGKFISGYRQTLNERGVSVSKEFPAGTLVMAIAANIGDVAILGFPAYFPDSVVGLRPRPGVDLQFLYYLMQAMKQPMMMTATISTQMNLNVNQIASMYAARPPQREQQFIVRFLDEKLENIDQTIETSKSAIALLHERRAALISAAVTGKIDVRNSAKVLPFPVGRVRARGLVAAEIIERSAHQATFGRVKLQKIAYLAEAHVGVTELNGVYLREAAGPLDGEMIRDMEREAGTIAGILVDQPDGAGSAVIYQLGDRRGAHRQELNALLGDRAAKLGKLIEDISTIDTRGAEAVATLYAVWNDALIDGETPSDMEIKLAVLSEWHPEKARKFRIDELQIWLDWMRRHGLVPTGAGSKTSTGRLFA